ncbi:MAG: hypothetical protein M5U26_08095 [Planctomycetota bacterium]|nr:hypothetical protein [Planctomycetota bacterium]
MPTRFPRLTCLGALLLTACILQSRPGTLHAGEALRLEAYDVRALCAAISHCPAPTGILEPVAAPEAPPNPTVGLAAERVLTAASIADVIRNRVKPESWDPNQGTSIEERAGQLFVIQRPEIHDLIRGLLDSFSKQARLPVTVRGLIVDVAPDEVLPFLGKAGTTFSQERVDAALNAGTLAAMPSVTCLNAQRAHVVSGAMHYYAARSRDGEPAPQSILEGIVFDVQPTLGVDGKTATLVLRLTANANVKIEPGAAPAPLAQQPAKRDEAPASQPVSVDQQAVRATLELPVGEWVLAALAPKADGRAQAMTSLVFVLVKRQAP